MPLYPVPSTLKPQTMKLLIKTGKTSLRAIISLSSLLSSGQTNTIKILTDIGTRYDLAYSIAIQSDDKVVVAGDAAGKPCIIRFDTTGWLDNTFGSDGKVLAEWDCGSSYADNDIKIQTDGKIVLGTRYYNGVNNDFIVARYHVDGTPDIAFGSNGKVITRIGSYGSLCNCIANNLMVKYLRGEQQISAQQVNTRILHFADIIQMAPLIVRLATMEK